MKHSLLLFIAWLYIIAGYSQNINLPRDEHDSLSCTQALTDSNCNLIPNPSFRCTGDSLEAFSDGHVFMWQDVNNLTADINGALAAIKGWNLPAAPSKPKGKNYASMLVDNEYKETEGISTRTFPLVNGKKYALSFFLSSSALSNYRTSNGTYTFKIFLANCQNFDVSSSGNPDINAEKQLIFCKSFNSMGDSAWQQYFVSFTADNDYTMLVVYPEVPDSSYDGGTYVHFLYPELIPINPTHQYQTYLFSPPDSTQGMTFLSACSVTNAFYQWEGPNGIVSTHASDVLAFSDSIGEDDNYTFSIWVEGAIGNNLANCGDAESPLITETALQIPTTERVSCPDPVTATNSCNIIPNATFEKTQGSSPDLDAFKQDYIQYWSSVNGGSPDLNGALIGGAPQPYPVNVPAMANAAGFFITTFNNSYYYEGIYAKIPQLVSGRTYAISFFLNTISGVFFNGPVDFHLKIALSNCQVFPIAPNGIGTNTPPSLNAHQDIVCQRFPGIETIGWQQYFVTFTADANYDLMVIYPQLVSNPGADAGNYIHFLMPELIDVTNLARVTETSACNYSLEACGVTNATYQWFDGNGNSIGTNNPQTVNGTSYPGPYTVTLTVPHILDNPDLSNTCNDNIETITAIAYLNKTTWVGGTSGNLNDWNTSTNWSPAVVPNTSKDVFIPTTTNQPVITSGTSPVPQAHNIVIEPGALVTNNGLLKIAGKITGDPGSITNYNGSSVAGSIEMNGTCASQTLAGNVFYGNDVKNFTVSNNVTISSTSGQGLDVYAELGFGTATSKTLTTGGNLTLVSNASTTANVAQIDASNFISGEVTVERYINTGTGAITNDHAAKWQALATPTGANSIGQTVRQSWMENKLSTSTPNGYGTNIPDPRSNWDDLGFDQQSTGNTAIKTYNSGNNGFDPIANTGIPLYNKNGYFIFVRGDRSLTSFFDIPNPTNLRSKGALFQPHTGYTPSDITVPATIPGNPTVWKFEMIGNPYASPISLDYMKNNNFTNLTNNVIVWDPLLAGSQGLGGYQTLHASTGYKPTPGGTALYDANTAYPEIQSGQAFFVGTPDNSTTGLVTFDEAVKSTNYRLVTRQAINPTNQKFFNANLYYGKSLCDGNTIIFENGFKNDIDANDAGKLLNPGENFMISRMGAMLSVETRQQIVQSDTIFYNLSNLRPLIYQLKFTAEHLLEEGLYAILIDKYLQQKIPLNLSVNSFIDFTVDENKSSYENRFMVIFEKKAKIVHDNRMDIVKHIPDGSSIGSFSIYPNPVKDKTINIHYSNLAAGRYKVQLINQTAQIVYNSLLLLKNNNGLFTVKPGKKVPSGFYQILIINEKGEKFIQQVIL